LVANKELKKLARPNHILDTDIKVEIERVIIDYNQANNKQTPWPESASELYGPSDRRLSEKLVPNFADRSCHVVSVTDQLQ
jgi:hypothetical protein